jgi:hypothetical protein
MNIPLYLLPRYYEQALKVRLQLIKDFELAFKHTDGKLLFIYLFIYLFVYFLCGDIYLFV